VTHRIRRTRRLRHAFGAPLVGGSTLLLVATLHAHDFWLVPNAFEIARGAGLEVLGQTSDHFPTSEVAVGPDRVAEARVLSAAGAVALQDLSVQGTSLRLRHRPSQDGQHLVAVRLQPRSVRVSADDFREYLRLEGAPEALERYERDGLIQADSLTRRWTKYAKTLVQVGIGGARAYDRAAGHAAEFVPLRDPSAVRPGDTLPVRLHFRGEPLAGARVRAGSVRGLEDGETERSTALVTDAAGIVRVPVDRAGMWNVRMLHVVPSDSGSGADWDTHWATLVFGISGEPSAAADSAAIADVVNRFHGALEAADSATVLALLTEEAIILENGVTETREEYRDHHLPGDIAFARAVRREAGPVAVRVRGDVGWATSTSVARGAFRDRPIHSRTAELMVLERTGQGWRIAAIHWSSRDVRS
jgi:uncharacterized GH25 family protein/ketosteroid isomerase-like protein